MKEIKRRRCHSAYVCCAVFLLSTGYADASLMTFTDKVDPTSNVLISFGGNISFSCTHNLLTDQDGAGVFWSGTYGYNSLTDVITDVSLMLRFVDESADAAAESVQFTIDNLLFGDSVITSGGAVIFSRTFTVGLNNFLDDGILNIALRNAGKTNGPPDFRSDFHFLDSTLAVSVRRNPSGQRGPSQVPLPTTITLLGIGLAGLGWSQRKCERNTPFADRAV